MTSVKFIRYPDDAQCMRASIGGFHDMGYYCSIRLHPGQDQSDIVKMLKAVTLTLEHAPKLEIESNHVGSFGSGAVQYVSEQDMKQAALKQLLEKAIESLNLNGLGTIANNIIKEAKYYGVEIR
jgi:hypothetical protein